MPRINGACANMRLSDIREDCMFIRNTGTSKAIAAPESAKKSVITVLSFLVGGVVGWVYETLVCEPMAGKPINLLHGGMGIPFLTIYAVGAFLIAVLLGDRLAGREDGAKRVLMQFLMSAVICTVVEYATGFFMLHALGIQTWTYLDPGWNFMASPDGLICLRASVTFGIGGLLLLRYIMPSLSSFYDKDGGKMATRVAAFGIGIFLLAMLNANVFRIVDTGAKWQ